VKKINIFGSTGSIGTQTLEVVEKFPNEFKVNILSGGNNSKLIIDQARRFNPKVVLVNPEFFDEVRSNLSGIRVYSNDELGKILEEFNDFDLSMLAVSGIAGLKFAKEIINHSSNKSLAIANKEAIVCCGDIFMKLIKEKNIRLIPVDSEHNSIFQLMDNLSNEEKESIDKLVITASGGPFLNYSASELELVTVADAVKHPRWSMGPKISVDSATLANKAFEIIEAHFLFDKMPVKALIHPESLVHAILDYKNGDSRFFVSKPDMRTHISHSLFYPSISKNYGARIDYGSGVSLNFQEIDLERFPFVKVAYDLIHRSGPYQGLIFTIADEIAVSRFLKGEIRFVEIFDCFYEFYSKNLLKNDLQSIDEVLDTALFHIAKNI
jgi:1-deoxy-D-xylulose-5-phosphate reductoisomerase